MQLIHKSYKTLIAIVLSVFVAGLFQSCEKEADFELKSFGPSGVVVRGGEISFNGEKLDDVIEITLPDGTVIAKSNFVLSSPEKIIVQIPEYYPLGLTGKVLLKRSNGQIIETQSSFMVFSSISVTSIEPSGETSPLKPGDEIAINGVNLEEIDAVIFKNGTICTDFKKDNTLIKMILPHAVSSGELTFRMIAGYDENGNPFYSEAKGPEITVVDPVLREINDESFVIVPPASEVKISGDYFGGIDIVNGAVIVKFAGSEEVVTGTIDVAGNTLTFSLPIKLQAETEMTIIISANGGKEVSSTATFKIEKTEVTGYEPESAWEPKGTVILVGDNLNAVSRLVLSRFVLNEDGSESEIEKAVPITKSADGKSITFTLPSTYGRDGREIPKLYLYSGGYIYYDYYPEN